VRINLQPEQAGTPPAKRSPAEVNKEETEDDAIAIANAATRRDNTKKAHRRLTFPKNPSPEDQMISKVSYMMLLQTKEA
jgi:hypothetical protein